MSRNKQRPGRAKPPAYVPSVQQLTGSPGPTVEALGKKWRLGFNDQDAKGALEELVRAHHTRRAVREKRTIGGEEGELVWSDFCAIKAQGFYDTFRPGWIATLRSEDGPFLFLQSLLQKHHPDVTLADAQEMMVGEPEQVMAAVEVVAPDFFAAVAIQKGHATEDAKAGAAEIARAVVAEIEKFKQTTTPEPATPSTS